MQTTGRKLEIGPTDNTSDQRTPRQPLRLIPAAARASFAPYLRSHTVRADEADMTRLAPGCPRAQGEPIEVTGAVRNAEGRALPNVMLEIWSANKFGRYVHAEDNSTLELDPNFLGQGRLLTNNEGAYRFLTILPGAYLARPDIGRWRPKHIHFSLLGGGARLITQMYFANDPHNDRDPMRILMGKDFDRNVAKEYKAAGDVARGFRFDIVIGGRNACMFENK